MRRLNAAKTIFARPGSAAGRPPSQLSCVVGRRFPSVSRLFHAVILGRTVILGRIMILGRVAVLGLAMMLVSTPLHAFGAVQAPQVSTTVKVTTVKVTTAKKKKHSFPGAKKVLLMSQTVKSEDGKLKLHIELKLPDGCKINPLAPMGYLLETVGKSGPIDRSTPSKYQLVKPPQRSFDLLVPVTGVGTERLRLSMNYYHCQGEPATGVCQTGSVIWEIPIEIDIAAKRHQVEIKYAVPPF